MDPDVLDLAFRHRTPWLNSTMRFITWFGGTVGVGIVCLAVALAWCRVVRTWEAARVIVFVATAAWWSSNSLKLCSGVLAVISSTG